MEKNTEAIRSDVFASYEKEFAQRMVSALSKGYLQELHEPPLVEIVEYVVNSVHNFIMRDHKTWFELITKSIFVHGNKSQVEFDFYGQNKQRELCDLIFIVSVVLNGQKYFEKFTLNQFKKEKRSSRVVWSLSNKEQLYLLSRFPSFRGVKGSLIPMKNYNLSNYSGCLGSYGLLHKPGDFAFVSATRLDSFIGDKKTLKMMELHTLLNNKVKHLFVWCPILYPPVGNIFGNCHFSHDVFNFVHEYLRMNIGEPIFMKIGIDNPQARNFLHELMLAIESKARKEKSKRILSFINAFRKFPYVDRKGQNRFNEGVDFDFEGGGIGIIHTTIDLRE